jgi:predicted aspartyl protease
LLFFCRFPQNANRETNHLIIHIYVDNIYVDDFYSLSYKMPIGSKHISFDIQIGFNNTDNEYKKHTLSALIDTGAERSAISKCLACKLGLTKIGSGLGTGSAGLHGTSLYNIDIILYENKIISNIEISEVYEGLGNEFIVGMDILTLGDVAITNMDGQILFSFRMPHNEKFIHFGREQIQKEENICYYCGNPLKEH